MEIDIHQLFVDTVRQEFGPLVAEGNLKQTQTLFDQPFLTTKVAFIGQNVSLELSLDGRDECVDCYVVRVVDSRPTDRWGYEDGNLRRYHLTELLRRHGGVDTSSLFTNVAGLELAERIPISVRDYARMVASYGQGILSDQYPIRGITHPERDPETPEALVAFLDALGDPQLARIMTAFKEGTAGYKRLQTFQLKETDGPSGIVYLSIQSDDIPNGWL